jgi:hypothetical protein
MPTSWRELRDTRTGKLLRLSDHDPIAARFRPPDTR